MCIVTGNSKLNKIKDGKGKEIIVLHRWTPTNLCITTYDEILVAIYNESITKYKVIRYSGCYEKETNQFDEDGNPL